MKIELNIKNNKVQELLDTCDFIIQQNKDINLKAWSLAIDIKKSTQKSINRP